jgi:16S rRNA (guanine527-N7)-methyltransferase
MEKGKTNLELITQYFADFSPVQLEQLGALQEVYTDWNNKINVISRKDIVSLYEKHILHSLSIAAAFQLGAGMQVIDIGTGGGFPGIPLAIFFPDTQFHLVDSIGKKLKVVEAVRDAIGLQNVTTQHIRAEEIKNRKFDLAVSRAVAPLKDLWTWSKPLLKKQAYRPRTNNEDPKTTNESPQEMNTSTQPVEVDLPIPHGLICLKGGDLADEISESGVRPRMMEIRNIFQEEYFAQKFLLYAPLSN